MSNNQMGQIPKHGRSSNRKILAGVGMNQRNQLVEKWSDEPTTSVGSIKLDIDVEADTGGISIAQQAMNEIFQEYEGLRLVLTQLENRLDPICTQATEDSCNPTIGPVEAWPPYFSSIRNLSYDFRTLRMRMDSIMARIGLD